LTTKIHAVVDALGNPVALSLTPGQAADITQAQPLLERLDPEALIADKGYDADAFVERLESRNVTPVIPPKTNRKQLRKTDFALYRERNLVERFFCTLKKFRAIATRYDKLASTFLAGVLLVCDHLAQLTTRPSTQYPKHVSQDCTIGVGLAMIQPRDDS
jgi:transposase